MNTATFEEKLNPEVRFSLAMYLIWRRGSDWVNTSPTKTNAVGNSDQDACRWVFLLALLSLEQRALAEGGDAVVNGRSY